MFLIGLMTTAVSRLMQSRGQHSRVAGFRALTFYRTARPGDTVCAGARGLAGTAGQLQVEITATTESGALLADGIARLDVPS